ncbi:MAG: LamG domain-containing protein [Myxococcales bacterium]|nr:LamG domain-containing protein [Myxococcales bacterium]
MSLATLTFGCGGEFIEGPPTVLPTPVEKVGGTADGVTISKRIRPAELALQLKRPDRNRLLVIPEDSRFDVDVRSLAGATTFSIEMWLRLDDTVDQTILSSHDLAVMVRDGVMRVQLAGATARGTRVVAGEWYHFALSVDRGEMRFFVNGGLSGLAEITGAYDDAMGRMLSVGGVTEAGGRGFSGRIDNLRLLAVPYTSARGFIPSTVLAPRDGIVAAFDFNAGEAPGERVVASTGPLVGELINQARVINGNI